MALVQQVYRMWHFGTNILHLVPAVAVRSSSTGCDPARDRLTTLSLHPLFVAQGAAPVLIRPIKAAPLPTKGA